MAENGKNGKNFLSGVLQSIGGSLVLSIFGAIWDKMKHGSVDWLGIAVLFILACIVLFTLFYFFRRSDSLPRQETLQPLSPQPQSSRLKIIEARYGVDGGPDPEVAEEYLKPRIHGDSFVGFVGADLFYGYQPVINRTDRRLKVRYSFDGKEAAVERPDHAMLVLPEDRFLKDQIEECKADLWRTQEASRQCSEELRESARLNLEYRAKLAVFSALQWEAMSLSCDLLEFATRIGPPPWPRYTRETTQGNATRQSQRTNCGR
jgi:hypothetical protein